MANLPLLLLGDDNPFEYSHSMTGGLSAGGEADSTSELWPLYVSMTGGVSVGGAAAYEYWPYEHIMEAGLQMGGTDASPDFVDVEEMIAGLRAGGTATVEQTFPLAYDLEMFSYLRAGGTADATSQLTKTQEVMDATLRAGLGAEDPVYEFVDVVTITGTGAANIWTNTAATEDVLLRGIVATSGSGYRADTANVTIPFGLTVSMSGLVGIIGAGAATLPRPFGTASIGVLTKNEVPLPSGIAVSASGIFWIVDKPALNKLPAGITISATVLPFPITGSANVAIPGGVSVQAATQITIMPAVPVDIAIPGPVAVSCVASIPNLGSGAVALPAGVEATVTAIITTLGNGAATLPGPPALSGDGLFSIAGASAATLPAGYALATVGGLTISGSAAASLPWPYYANATQLVGLSLDRVNVLTVATAAVTEYEGFGFNSAVTLGGKVFAAGASGISELTGGSDNGTAIAARARTGELNFGAPALKRPGKGFLDGRIAGYMRVSCIVGTNQYDYSVEPHGDDTRAHRFSFGRGIKHNYLQFEIANEDGADFDLEAMRAEIDGVKAHANAKT